MCLAGVIQVLSCLAASGRQRAALCAAGANAILSRLVYDNPDHAVQVCRLARSHRHRSAKRMCLTSWYHRSNAVPATKQATSTSPGSHRATITRLVP